MNNNILNFLSLFSLAWCEGVCSTAVAGF